MTHQDYVYFDNTFAITWLSFTWTGALTQGQAVDQSEGVQS